MKDIVPSWCLFDSVRVIVTLVIDGEVSTANRLSYPAMMSICCGTISSNVASSDYYSRRQQLILYLLCLVGTFTHSSRVPIDSLIIREVRCSAKLISLFGDLKCSHLFNFVCLLVCFFFLMLPFSFTSQWLKQKNVLPSEHGNTYYAVGFKRLRKNVIFSQRQE